MSNITSKFELEKSYDEQKIFEVLQRKDLSFRKTMNIHADNLPAEKEFHELGCNISNYKTSMNALMINPAPRPVTSKKKLFAPIIVFFRKIIRKFFLKWYIEPICDQQTDFNIATHNTVANIVCFNEKQLSALNELYQKHEKLCLEFQAEHKLRLELEKRIKKLEQDK